jgi:YVTN family beta-propeller protein
VLSGHDGDSVAARVIEYAILGSLRVSEGDQVVVLGGGKQRALLALLLLHRNEVVAADRLVEELWSGEPPATAAKIVQLYVSQLRKVLGDGVLVTRPPGYMLNVEAEALDADRFERLLADGRRMLADGAAELASARLREALALWRGPPLSDFAYEEFAQREIARLEELRLAVLEERIEADLALGRHADLVGELEALVSEHRLRERLRGQLMLALYRCGRQAEALEAYQDVRRMLVHDLGLEPGQHLQDLEQAILRHDPALAPPARVEPPLPTRLAAIVPPSLRRRGPAVILVGAVLLGAGIAAAAFELARGSGAQEPRTLASLAPDSLGQIDPKTNRIVGQVPVGARPDAITAGDGSLWVGNLDDHTIARIDPRTRTLERSIALAEEPDSLAAGRHVWVVDGPGTISRIDEQFNSLRPFARVREKHGFGANSDRGLALGFGSLWASSPIGIVSRIDPTTGRVVAQIEVGNKASGLAVGAGSVWVANSIDGTVSRIDPTNIVTATIPVGHGPTGIAVGARGVWVTNYFDGTVVRIDPATNTVVASVRVGDGPLGIAATPKAVWVANSESGSVSRVDPATNRVRTIPTGARPARIAVAGGSVWVTVQRGPVPVATGGTARFDLEANPTLDPAVAYDTDSYHLLYATCAQLLNYPDEAGRGGAELVPEVAAAMPSISTDGKTYTFTVRPGFRFSPPSNEPVTAATFKHAIERALDPRARAGVAQVLGDVVGARAFTAGKARQISGIVARADTLTVRLVAPSGDLPARLSIPSFCAVPINTPIDPRGVGGIPSAGPYYVASYTPSAQVILKRNPNYHAERPHRLAEIDVRIGVGQDAAMRDVENGTADYAASGIPPSEHRRLAVRYGLASPAAHAGRQQYFADAGLNVRYLLLNSQRPLFADVRLRRAVNYAIDRPPLVAATSRFLSFGVFGGGLPNEQYLPPAIPGYSTRPLYPRNGPDLATARRLARGRGGTAVMFTCNRPPCPQIAAIVRHDLAQIGIQVKIRELPSGVLFARASRRDAPFDILLLGWSADYPDPGDFLNTLFANRSPVATGESINFAHFDDPRYNRDLAAAARLSGAKRYRVYAELSQRLARDAAPAVAYETDESRDFFSARIGCQLYQPVYGMDIGALCLRHAPA